MRVACMVLLLALAGCADPAVDDAPAVVWVPEGPCADLFHAERGLQALVHVTPPSNFPGPPVTEVKVSLRNVTTYEALDASYARADGCVVLYVGVPGEYVIEADDGRPLVHPDGARDCKWVGYNRTVLGPASVETALPMGTVCS